MPAKHKQMPAADMAMPAPQLFQYTRDAGPQCSQCFSLRICRKWVFLKLRFGLSVITTTTVQWSSQPVDSPKMLLIIAWACNWFFHCRAPLIALARLLPRARPDSRGNNANKLKTPPPWKQVWHTVLPSMHTAVALATPSPRHLPSFKFLKPQTG